MAVTHVQPLSTSSWRSSIKFGISVIVPCARYAMIAIGITISFAGNPNIKAINIIPSSPMRRAKGSRKFAQYFNKVTSPTVTFANIQITNPAGAATAAARPKTKSVLSQMERTMIRPTCGFLYGGNSRVKEEGIPFKIVWDNSLETANVIKIPRRITRVKSSAERTESNSPPDVPIKNIVKMAMMVGNTPPSKR